MPENNANGTTTTRRTTTSNNNKKKLKLPSTIQNGWFTETDTFWPGQKFSLALEEFSSDDAILYHERSAFQDILVFKSAQYGMALVLDGVIQLTERDEFSYRTCIVL